MSNQQKDCDAIYVDVWGIMAIRCESSLYEIIRNGMSFRQLQDEAVSLGVSAFRAQMATDEQLLYMIAKARGDIRTTES